MTVRQMLRSFSTRRLVFRVLGCALAWTGCSNPPITTPTRSLDRPSDLALFCVEFESKDSGCLPSIDPESDPQGYLDAFCSNTGWRATKPLATVLPTTECDDSKRRLRRDAFYRDPRRAAQLLGRDPDRPCCNTDDTGCTAVAPTCMYRSEMALIVNTVRGEVAVADTVPQAPGLSTYGRLANLHGGKPGFGFLPVGNFPLHIRATVPVPPGETPTTFDGRYGWAASSNAGSCDFSVLRLQAVANLLVRPPNCDDADQTCAMQDCDAESCPKLVQPWVPSATGGKTLLSARPGWLEIAPWSRATERRIVVAFPTCGIVASVDVSDTANSGHVYEAIAFDPKDSTKPPKILTAAEISALKCAADCGGDSSPLPPDAVDLPPGGAKKPARFPVALAVDTFGSRMLVSDGVGDSVTVLDYDLAAADGAHFLGSPRQIKLDFEVRNDGRTAQLGLDAIRISPRTAAGQFAYIVAKDSSVRVVDLDREIECETNPDPRFLLSQAGSGLRVLPDELLESNLRRLSCLPVDKTKTPRAPLSNGPGLTLPNASLPRDVGVTHVDIIPCTSSDPNLCAFSEAPDPSAYVPSGAGLWVGDFAWILGGAGSILGVQIADRCPSPSYRACFPEFAALRRVALLHTRSQALTNPEQLDLPSQPQALWVQPQDRLGNVRRVVSRFDEFAGTGTTGPRPDSDGAGLPVQIGRLGGSLVNFSTTLLDSTTNLSRKRLLLPTLAPYYYLPVDPVCDVAIWEQATTLTSPDQNLPVEPTRRPATTVAFVDPNSTLSENWTLSWEGVLSGLGRTTGLLQPDGTLIDLNGLYCSRGVEPDDKLWISGCYSNSDCPSGQLCKREQTQVSSPGLCMNQENADKCQELSKRLVTDDAGGTVWAASWLRRYQITKAEQQIVVAGNVTDRLTLEEIPEPEFVIERQLCSTANLTETSICDDPLFAPPIKVREGAPGIACRVTGRDALGKPSASCIRQCQESTDCGSGFVCAHSHFEQDEAALRPAIQNWPARCVRAPLLAEGTPWQTQLGSKVFQRMSRADVDAVKFACFPDQVRYETRAGNSMVVRGDRTSFGTLVQRGSDGVCRRPTSSDTSYYASRTLEPRIRLGPHASVADGDPLRCPSSPTGWIGHRIPASPQAVAADSCGALWNNGGTVALPRGQSEFPLHIVRGQDFYPQPPNLKTEKQGPVLGRPPGGWQWDPECVKKPSDPRCTSDIKRAAGDPWLNREFELFSMLPLDGGQNQCILTGPTEEEYPANGAEQISCTGFCRFPGDHTEIQGVRRIHYENHLGNMVLRLPRRLTNTEYPLDPNKTIKVGGRDVPNPNYNPAVWAVPPEGFSVVFSIVGGTQPFVQYAQTSTRDASSGILAQGLRAAAAAQNGVVYLVDEGRSGSSSGLRGQVMRLIGSVLDPYFLLR